MSDINDLLPHLSDEDRANFIKAVSGVGDAFESQTTIVVDPEKIANLPAVREHVLSGAAIALDLEAAIASLKADPSISAKLIAAEIVKTQHDTIRKETAGMSRQAKMTYARERGLDRPRSDVSSEKMTLSEHLAVLQSLSPTNRIAYARRHGIS
ncbi:hypothetical protein [Sulfitobacter pontiacus]|uniref:hypothetical protein n=1 Tax=Sulfitobacter pontiacus TaxID=60137 RepID=UPI0030EE99A4